MLVLTFKNKAEADIYLDDEGEPDHIATVKVLEIQGTRVKLGFEADPDVAIVRADAKNKTVKADRASN